MTNEAATITKFLHALVTESSDRNRWGVEYDADTEWTARYTDEIPEGLRGTTVWVGGENVTDEDSGDRYVTGSYRVTVEYGDEDWYRFDSEGDEDGFRDEWSWL